MAILTQMPEIRSALAAARTVAVLGASTDPSRAGFYVPEYLVGQGYRVWGVNPNHAGHAWFGRAVLSRLAEVPEAIDLVDVFRHAAAVTEHVDEILALSPLPRVVWLQLGVRNDDAADRLVSAGIDVVQDRCTLADHQALAIGRVTAPHGAG